MSNSPKREGGMTLRPEQIERYNRDGFLLLTSVFSESEIEPLRNECDRLAADTAAEHDIPEIQPRATLDGGVVHDRFDPVINDSPVFEKIAHNDLVRAPLRALFGEDVFLLKDKLICKPPGAMGYGMHQDFAYWDYLPVTSDAVCSALIAIDAASSENGALQVVPSLHHDRLPAPPEDARDVDESQIDLSNIQLIEMQPGDVLYFHCLTPHRSGPNTSDFARRSLFLTFNAARCGNVYDEYQTRRHSVNQS